MTKQRWTRGIENNREASHEKKRQRDDQTSQRKEDLHPPWKTASRRSLGFEAGGRSGHRPAREDPDVDATIRRRKFLHSFRTLATTWPTSFLRMPGKIGRLTSLGQSAVAAGRSAPLQPKVFV
jgi:hypothetical protein